MKTVLITGGTRGIGAACVEEFSKKGWNVVVNYKKSDKEAADLKSRFGTYTIRADVSSRIEVDKMYNELKNLGIHVDCIVNNAGISADGLFTDISEEEWDKIFAVNVKGAFLVTKRFLPDMISKHSGSIVNISSIWGQVGAALEVCYSSSKAAVIGMTKALAKEVAPSGIRVNCVCPGYIDTDMNNSYSEDDVTAICEEIPLMRVGEAREAAKVIEFISSDAASYMTGQTIGVNGGWNI